MSARSRLAALGALVAGLLGGTARGEEPAPAPPTPAPARARLEPQGGTLRLRLADAVALGIARNLEIAAGSYDPAIACETVREEVGEFDPLLTLGFEAARTETPERGFFTGTGVLEETLFGPTASLSKRTTTGGQVSLLLRSDRLLTNSGAAALSSSWLTQATLEARQPLLRGAGVAALADVRRARVAQRAAEHGFREVAEDVLLRIEEAYWDLVFAGEQLEARRKSEEVASGLFGVARSRFEAEVGTPIEVAEATAGVESRRGDRILAEGLFGEAEDRLRALVLPFEGGRPIPLRLVAVDDPRAGVPALPGAAEETRWTATALRRRPDLLRTLAELERNDVDVALARNEFAPQLDLVGRASAQGLDGTWPGSVEDLFEGEAQNASLGVTFSVYLGRRSARARLRIAEYERRQAGLLARELESRVVLDVRRALRQVATASERGAAAAAEIRAAQESLEGERAKVGQGASTPFAVLEREERVTQAVTREGRAAADVRIALARLHRAAGLLADAHRVKPPSCAVDR
jgi:outer membrane protein